MNPNLREITSNSIRFWEPCRIIYNLVFGAIILTYFFIGFPRTSNLVTLDGILGFFILAVIANILFCAAYLPDIFAQLSAFRDLWLRVRWIIFAIGMLFAGVVTRWITIGAFGSPFTD